MRRALASAILAVFGFQLIAPAICAGTKPNHPECCRRTGKHHCASAANGARPLNGVPQWSAQSHCPLYPTAQAAVIGANPAALQTSGALFYALVSHPAIHLQTEAGYRISCGRSSMKRGPPLSRS